MATYPGGNYPPPEPGDYPPPAAPPGAYPSPPPSYEVGPQQQSGTPTLVKVLAGCGCGCLLLLGLGVAAIGLGTFGLYAAMGEGRAEIQANIRETYARLQAEGAIPAEHAEQVDRIITLAMAEEASILPMTMGFMSVVAVVQDGEVDAQEAVLLNDAETLLEANNWLAFFTFAQKHPDLQGRFNAIEFESFDSGSEGMWEGVYEGAFEGMEEDGTVVL